MFFKKFFLLTTVFTLILSINSCGKVVFSGGEDVELTGNGGEETNINEPDPLPNPTPTSSFVTGDIETFGLADSEFNMIYVEKGFSFPIEDDTIFSSVDNPFMIAEKETTYDMWYEVRQWALTNGYTFANAGLEGRTNPFGTIGAVPFYTDQPVTFINWRDAMVWTNALTEYHNFINGTNYETVYKESGTPLRDSTDAALCDYVVADETANGFRLLTSDEWELAARYKGNDSNNGAIEYPVGSGDFWTPGNYASGATADITDTVATELVAWTLGNSPDPSGLLGLTKQTGTKTSNALGLYDMSGNVAEWVFDLYEDIFDPTAIYRRIRSGSVNQGPSFHNYLLQISYGGYSAPAPRDATWGFRIGKNAE